VHYGKLRAFKPCHNQASWQANCRVPKTTHANAPVIMLVIMCSHMRRGVWVRNTIGDGVFAVKHAFSALA